MSEQRLPPRSGPAWQATLPCPLPEPVAQPQRSQPPLTEKIKGLATRELEGQTVFDQLFGGTPPPAR